VAARQLYWIQVCLEKLHMHFMRSMDLRKAVMGLSCFWNSAGINLFVGTDIKYDEKEEVVNMCKAWDDHKKLGIQEGMKQGRCLEVYSLVQDGILDPEVGARRVSMSLDDFADAMKKAGYKIPELV